MMAAATAATCRSDLDVEHLRSVTPYHIDWVHGLIDNGNFTVSRCIATEV